MALCERLGQDVVAVRAETQLHAIGHSKYVTEETVIRFVKECEKGLRLDLVKNFMRTIPDDVSAKKTRCDELGLFDNYAVLHFDPETKAWAETQADIAKRQADIAKRRDPILFGLIAGRRRLYFIGDWVDEHCNLTLEQLADLIGEAAIAKITPNYETT